MIIIIMLINKILSASFQRGTGFTNMLAVKDGGVVIETEKLEK